MAKKIRYFLSTLFLLILVSGCSIAVTAPPTLTPSQKISPTQAAVIIPTETSTSAITPTSTITLTPTPTEIVFEVGKELTIEYLREQEFTGSEITFEQKLADRSNYYQYLASYISEGNKIYTVRLKDLVKRGDVSANVDVKPGDVLVIPESWF